MMMMMEHSGSGKAGEVRSPTKQSQALSSNEVSVRQTTKASAHRMLMIVWMSVGMLPLILQARSYLKFVTPHKLTEALVVPVEAAKETTNIAEFCPVEGLFIANSWWNVAITHYYSVHHGRVCHFVIPQYNIHGSYILGVEKVKPSSTTPANCAGESYPFEHYFYHGSIGYYSFYEEAVGTYCAIDKTAYVLVQGLGTLDSNGSALSRDRGGFAYRNSYWSTIFGLAWMVYRVVLLRKSYILCKRYGKRYDHMQEKLSRKAAIVFMQENMRLTSHSSTNYFRIVIFYMLLEGVMNDLFLLIAQDGPTAKIQYISLGYNLSGMLSMVFEMVESMKWLSEKARLLLKRLFFSYETSLLGEFLSAGLMNTFLTSVNRSSLKDSRPVALAVSYYVWGLVGHVVLVLGLTAFTACVRILFASAYMLWYHRTFAVLVAPCSVDTTLGSRCKMIMLSGYVWQNRKLYYSIEALKAFGVLRSIAEDGVEYFVFRRMLSMGTPTNDLLVIGSVSENRVSPCRERLCTGTITLFDRPLGGGVETNQNARIIFAANRVQPHISVNC